MNTLSRKFRLLFTLLLVLCLVLVVFVFDSTISRYIKQQRDEIYATYTSLYFESDLKDGSVVLENGEAYLSFKLKNYIGEDITKRKLTYQIGSLSLVDINKNSIDVDSSGNMTQIIDGVKTEYNGDLYVQDVWGTPQLVGKNSNKYNISIIDNDGDVDTNGDYCFPYTIGTEGTADNHTVTVKINRIAGPNLDGNEEISIVVQLKEPYSEILIINVKVMNHLISHNISTKTVYETEYDVVNVQTANIFSHYYDDTTDSYKPRNYTVTENGTKYLYEFTPKAFKIELSFKGYLFHRLKLNNYHIDITGDTTSSNESIVGSYMEELNNSSTNGSIIGYAPQGSDFSIEFLNVDSDSYQISAMIYVYLVKYKIESDSSLTKVEEKYYPYIPAFGGYPEFANVDANDNPVKSPMISSN